VAAVAFAAVYAMAISWLAIAQHVTFNTRARDMGIYAQVLWNTGHGQPFTSTLLEENTLHIAEHVAPVLALLAPLYALVPDPRLLLVIQQLCLAGAGLVLFFWVRRRIGDLAALALLAGFYAMPAMSRVALSEFHPIVMATLPMTLGLVAVLDGRVRPAVVWLSISLLFEEETAPLVGAAGAYLLLVQRRRAGLAIGALAVIWLVILVLVFMPAFHDPETLGGMDGNRTTAHFEQVSDNPGTALEWLVGERGAEAAIWLIGPAVGLPLLAPEVLALAVPAFMILFLQDREGTFAGHWSAAMLPVFWLAATVGLVRLAGRAGRRRSAVISIAVVAVLAASGLSCWRYSLFPGGRGSDSERFRWTEHQENLARAVALAPTDTRLDATRRIVPHLAHRPQIYQFPSTFYSAPMRPDLRRIETFVLDLTDSQTRRALDATDEDTVLTREPRFNVQLFGPEVLLLTRERRSPAQPMEAVFGETMKLVGYDVERRGDALRLAPYWESMVRLRSSWTRVAELIAPDGRSVARDEAIPLDPYLPPPRWDRRQVVIDSVDLRLPPTLPAGRYLVTIAWREVSGRPVPLADGAERVEIPLSF
jgi:uncharacterized membrane protein